jgi:hypothetical protein
VILPITKYKVHVKYLFLQLCGGYKILEFTTIMNNSQLGFSRSNRILPILQNGLHFLSSAMLAAVFYPWKNQNFEPHHSYCSLFCSS